MSPRPLLIAMLVVAPLSFGLAGCETLDKLNPFVDRQPPLPGERKPLFPEGVPGVDFGAPPQQPTNSNIPIAPQPSGGEQSPQQSGQAQPAQQPAPPARTSGAAKGGNPNDAWSGTR